MGKTDQGVVALWAARHFFGGSLSYIGYGGTGKQVRDLLHVDDLYRLINLEIANLGQHNGAVYNVGGGTQRSVSLCELTRLCEELFGRQIEIGCVPDERPADIPCFVSDTAKVRQATGWEPVKTVADILADIRGWLVEHQAVLEPVFQEKS
jgi:CDP-paratose 2-epimerase